MTTKLEEAVRAEIARRLADPSHPSWIALARVREAFPHGGEEARAAYYHFLREEEGRSANSEPQAPATKSVARTYRHKHAVEAMRWTDTDEDREHFADWFEDHDAEFETCGRIVWMPDNLTLNHRYRAFVGEWIVWTGEAFVVMSHARFCNTYEEISP